MPVNKIIPYAEGLLFHSLEPFVEHPAGLPKSLSGITLCKVFGHRVLFSAISPDDVVSLQVPDQIPCPISNFLYNEHIIEYLVALR
jgi:hypothetical protein